MSESEDDDSRTEEASEKKILDALEQGKTPVARDVAVAVLFLGFLLCVSFVIETVGPRLALSMELMLSNVGQFSLANGADAFMQSRAVAEEIGRFLAPMLSIFMITGLLSAAMQGAPRLVFKRIEPDLSRISPQQGLKRIFGVTGVVELVKSIAKIAVIGGAVVFSLTVDRDLIIDAMRMEPAHLPSLLLKLIIRLTSVVCIPVVLIALADLAWSKFKWRRDMRMSRQEMKEEHKQSEGDPLVKARMRSLALERSRKRMMAQVPQATMVIANPTHYAIALRYVRTEGGAPTVVAKGKDLVALKIREIAEAHGVPVLERPELARAMYNHVEVDQMIPSEFYRPVAELIHFLQSTRGSSAR
ncbi:MULTISPECIES: flagellar biosynthesis protein FlhB [Methylosinus]|uniref:Flagellar biosynthetic protein FlhB n=1 Tax=Methylosinus trichosporium (strain ATCC 35070 / NCIMB 11131 / UNIQEM 75 / OB3b) TaxID=595536 RepID=A0A2D2D3V6_METT3|nr:MULTISPECIES: flagellar biosynthesis protein FlhB [Methylosinus]ATQ69691.1 flagellar biosynthesis protein FlhB [Methylosinus trichosporium OB3b]OBS51223.1 flagellar biosynthesis protein FlhB [Methylosinus sp. 3S-1]